jgi:iron complex transport system substrate-binding protein
MKFVLGTLLLLLRSPAVLAQQPAACLTTVDSSTDYFPIKVSPSYSQKWSVNYFNTYKIVTNIDTAETYLLYQCGSVPPQAEVNSGVHKAVISIPVSNIGVEETPTIPFLEHLGLVNNITAFTSDPSSISSPCFLQSIEKGQVIVLQSMSEFNTFASSGQSSADTLLKLENTIGFTSPFTIDSPFNTTVKVSEYAEKTNEAIFEWIKFYSTFFNLEAKANEVFNITQERWNCVAQSASRVQSDNPNKPVVLWAYYSDYCGGWDSGECPNYYCEFAQRCSATLLSSTAGTFSEKCKAVYLTTDELVALGKDADYWIYPSPDWNTTYYLFKNQLDTMKSVQNKKVYDYQGLGMNAWFEERFAQYYYVLQDFCSVVGTTASLAGKNWFRNVLDGSKIGVVGNCTESSRASSTLPTVGAVCSDLNLTTTKGGGSTSGVSALCVGANGLFTLLVVALYL